MADFKYSAGIDVNLNVKGASNQLKDLQKQLQQISNMKVDIGTGNLTADIEKASEAAMKLSAHLATATNPQTGNLDFTKFYTSIQKSGASLEDYGKALQNMGPAGQKAFVSLADSISKAEIPLKRTSKLVDGMWDNLKKTVGWQISSSMVHGFIGSMQQAVGYAKDLNKSLTDIRIVTGASTDQMAQFAKQANQAAKNLSTTTTDYTKASLIYYQQGLSDAEVKQRTETTIKMANATGTSAQTVSDQMTAIWNNFDNGTKSLTHYADVMTALGAATASSTDEIAEGLQKFASISDTVGLSYEYAASALATITSTSRESADVVGNSLKTLFSRIQGLQLGETLDDGTTLNKYSTAMAKVGISIKDSSGELKDMDTILDEMGSTWKTLANDEKMALAQTVAGVRQYTQLMTLMENWDQFKQNLNIANTSGGTLDAQAAIYAESWEAASNRVRASWEGLWDNLIDSDGAVAVLDTMSSFVDVLNAITTGLGGAGGALSHFSAIFLKLFTPKIGENINNIGYGIKMMLGGRDQMKSAREEWLENTKGSLSGDSGIFDIGVSEGKAYQDVLQQRINTSLAYSQHWDSMSAEERIYAQAAQKRYEDFGANYIEAGKNYDAYKNALGESYWDLYSLEDNKAVNPLDKREKSLLPSEQEQLKSHQEALRKIQGKETESFKKQRVEHEAIIKELTDKQGLTYGERLKKQASAMLDFENTIGSLGDNSIENMKAFENSWKQLDEVLSTVDEDKIPRGAKLFKENMQALIESGDIEGAKAYAAGSTKGLNDIVARTFADNLGLDRDALLSYMDNATSTEMSKRNFEAYQNYQKQLEQQELQGRKKDPRNWGEGLTSAAEGAMATMSLVQQIKALTEGGMSAGEVISSLVTGVGSAGMAISGFASALQAVGAASGAAAGWIGLLITALGVLGSFAIDYFSDIYNADKISAQQASETAIATASAHQEAINYNASLKSQVQTYQDAQNAINQMELGSIEREQSIYENNKLARSLISQEGLSEQNGDFTHAGGQIKISDSALRHMQERAEERVLETDATAQLSQQVANEAILKSSRTDLERDMLSQGGSGIGAKVLTGLEWGMGAFLTAAGIATGWTGAGLALAGTGIAGMAHASSKMQDMNNYEKDVGRGLSLIEKDNAILDKKEEEFLSFLTEQGISEQAAQILWENKTQLSNYTRALKEQNLAYDLMSESLTRNIVAQNENINNLGQNEKILNGATQKYSEAVDNRTKELSDFSDKSYNDKQALADQVKGALGLENLQDFQWTGDNTKDKELTYTYTDASGATVDGQVSYDRIVNAQVSQAGVNAVDQYANDMANVYNKLQQNYDTDTTNGLFSMLAGDNFSEATQKEIDAAMKGIDDLQKKFAGAGWEEYATQIQNIFGMTTEQFQKTFNVDFTKIHFNDWLKQFEGFQSSAQKLIQGEPLLSQWVGDNKSISDNLTQNTLTSLYDSFKKASLLGGEESGKAMLDGITSILSDSGLDESDYNAAVQGLLAIDWTDTLTSGGAAAEIIRSLGGELNTTTAAWEAFAAAMAAAAGAMPDFSGIISQLTQLAGALQGLTKGGTVSADIRDQLVAMNPEFADLFSKHYSGDYTFIGDDNTVLSDAIWDNMNETKAEAGVMQQRYEDYMNGAGKGQADNDTIGRENFTQHYEPGRGYVVNSSHASQLGVIAGYDQQAQSNILNNYDSAKYNLDAWGTESGTYVNGQRVRMNGEGKFEVQDGNGDWKAATNYETFDFTQEYQADQAAYGTAKGAMDTMLDSIHGLDEVSGEWKPEEIEQAISTANSLSEVIGRIREGQAGLVDENGNLTESTLKGIEAWAAQHEVSERTQAALEAVAIAQENLNNAKGEDEISAAQKILDEALAQVELSSAIDEVAAARGLDVDQIAYQIEMMEQEGIMTNTTAKAKAEYAAELIEQSQAIKELNQDWSQLQKSINSTNSDTKYTGLSKLQDLLNEINTGTHLATKSTQQFEKAYSNFIKNGGNMQKLLKGDREELKKLSREASKIRMEDLYKKMNPDDDGSGLEKFLSDYENSLSKMEEMLEGVDLGIIDENDFANGIEGVNALEQEFSNAVQNLVAEGMSAGEAMSQVASDMGVKVVPDPVSIDGDGFTADVDQGDFVPDPDSPDPSVGTVNELGSAHLASTVASGQMTGWHLEKIGGAGGSGGGGGGGGGGGAKEPKKVANKRKSQTVKRYKRNDAKRSSAEKSKKSAENQKDYLYGEQKIAQMEKINKLAEKEARITADRISESRKYLVEDRENLIKYMQKYGFEAEFDADGFLSNYEEAWTKIYEEIAALYEDNLLTEDEEKIEEDLNIKLEELEGALEDYENSLSELADDIEAYEESLYEMYDNKVEVLQHKVEFKIELEEDDLEYLDFWIETLGDNIYNSIEAIEAMGEKANMLFNGLDVYKQGVQDIYDLSNDPLQVWATGGLEDVLTQDQVDALRENRDGLMDYMQQLIDLREEIKDKVLETFESWQEKIDATSASLEHYTSVIEYFKNIIDIVGKDPFGLSDQFMDRLEQSAIDQSMDNIDANKAYYESLVEQQEIAQEKLNEARARGDKSSEEHWEEVVRTTTEAAQEAQDAMLSSLENTLTMIAEQFETAMQRAVDAFNDAIYAHGGLEGLSNDYDMIRENADLMAADYEKIYELSKLTRDINKVLDDTNIVAGKKKMNSLLKEINELQADGVELSKYDLEYLRAKYELRLAEIELENTQNSKDTVRLSKDSEGNWSYIYTQNADAVEEAEQKYEDALYEMQNLSQEYLEEMSGMMLETSQAMMEEISALRIQDFTSYEAYQTEIKRIQDKYAESLKHQENELNKAIQNSSDLYEQDWQAYNRATGYKISLAENWVDSFREATLGDILDIDTFMSGFSDTFLGLTEQMSAQLADAAVQYFTNVDTAMKTYGTSIEGFGKTATTTIDSISQKSKTAKDDLKVMASEMSDAFKEIADYVSDWQEEFSGQIDAMLEEIKTLIQSINEAIRKSAELTDGQSGAEGLIGSDEAIELLNETGLFGTWSKDGSVGVKVDGKATNFVDYNGALIEEIDEAVARYANAKTGTEEREKLGEELKELFKRYWQFRDIVNRVYDPTNLTANMDAPTFTSMDTGGYTGEWGDSGKFAMLHEKELVLNAKDTQNFLDALNISRDVINSMIEMNARASSLALGDLFPSLVQDFGQTLEQTVTITAEFPDATDRNEIEEAFNNLLNTASQYANRNNV